MAGRSRMYRFLLLVIAVFALAGCSSPLGSIGEGSAGSVTGGDLEVTADPRTFDFGDDFLLRYLTVSHNGVPVSINDCTVYIRDPSYMIVPTTGYPLYISGTKDILVRSNNNLTGTCTITVRNPGVSGGGGGGGSSGSTQGINIEGPY